MSTAIAAATPTETESRVTSPVLSLVTKAMEISPALLLGDIVELANGSQAPTRATTDALKAQFGLITMNSDMQLPDVAWFVEGLLPSKSLFTVIGNPKLGKSWVGLDLAVTTACGGKWLGRELLTPGPVIYLLGEGHLSMMAKRVNQLLAGRGLTLASLGDRLHFIPVHVNAEDRETQLELNALVRGIEPVLVVFDPLARFLESADENSARDLRPLINWWYHELVRECGASLCVVHHTTKDGKTARGSGDLLGMGEVDFRLSGQAGSGQFQVNVTPRNTDAVDPFNVKMVCNGESMILECGTDAGPRPGAVLRASGVGASRAARDILDDEPARKKIKAVLAKAPEGVSINTAKKKAGLGHAKAKALLESEGVLRDKLYFLRS